MADNKDTIYIDVDDDITAIIDKVKASTSKVVAVVLPKRASVLQSIVNMKLLKRTADNLKKNLVLVTTEPALLPLAGAVGVHVAKTPTSSPQIPPAPAKADTSTETVDEDMSVPLDSDDEESPDLTKDAGSAATVGALSDATKKPDKDDGVLETLNLDNDDEDEKSKPAKSLKQKVLKNKHLKIPNFNRFRTILLLSIVGVIGLVVLAVFAFMVWPKASITIKTDATTVSNNLDITLDPQATSIDYVNSVIPAKSVTEQKTFTQTVNTTGQKNVGTTASGQVTLSASDCTTPYTYNGSFTIPAGTGISYNNMTYITQNNTDMYIPHGGIGVCITYKATASTDITAQNPGAQYNAQIQNGTVANYPEVVANGSASNGTDNIVPVVSQADLDTATTKINANNNSTALSDLSNQLKGQGYYPINVTLTAGSPQVTSNPGVGVQATTVTVTEIVTYTMFGAKESDLNALLESSITGQTNKNQNIISNGLNESAFKQTGTSGNADQVNLTTTAIVGPNISVAQVKQEIKGKSAQAAISSIKQNPDVTKVTIKLSPFYVSSIPNNLSKITVVIAKPNVSSAK